MAAVAVSLHALGVDIELDHGVSPQWASLSPSEHQAILGLDAADRPGAFLRLWTAKEAVLKVAGRGLVDDPASIDVHQLLHSSVVVVDGAVVHSEGRWQVRQVSVDDRSPPLVAALADRQGGPVTTRWFVG
jgi:phosphopantetheinyl transferase